MHQILEQLNHITVRIICDDGNGNQSTGTGYIFTFFGEDKQEYPVIITNKHVVDGMKSGGFNLTIANDDGSPDVGNHEFVNIWSLQKCCLYHPNPDVDLVAVLIGYSLNYALNKGVEYYFRSLSKDILPTQSVLNELYTVEDIIMIGYPNGLWDEKHNLPIYRKGVTATHAGLNLNGRPEFLIDAACFPGSSGSPVFLFNKGGYINKNGSFVIGGTTRIVLLGTLWGGPTYTSEGEVKVVNIPTSTKPISVSKIPSNLGFVIHASELLVFDKIIEKFINGLGAMSINKFNVIPKENFKDKESSLSRNAKCNCGSGKKYKHCCGKI
ncbi:MAG: trypsin-like peptidase domain-containing protein [Providencia sp.]|uniref:trypsin-like peptidase domain-containing protein n=1 Tax=Providencia sp. TaxID=589 RepID=UPI001B4C9B91|nr:trypsin-like peptidase domain-containing protein [Providencia sp.]MBP6083477.1 trypsin-like peptidase domain-containing protein [Providencia sp.]